MSDPPDVDERDRRARARRRRAAAAAGPLDAELERLGRLHDAATARELLRLEREEWAELAALERAYVLERHAELLRDVLDADEPGDDLAGPLP